MKYGLFIVWWAAMLFLACHPDILNTDPVHGGQCGNGDQLATLCPDQKTCCPNGYVCAADFGCQVDESQVGPDMVGAKAKRAKDAGR